MAQFFRWSLLVILISATIVVEGVMDKKVALVIASKGFQPVEYAKTKDVLEQGGITVVSVSEKSGTTIDAFDKSGPDVKLTVKDIDSKDYVGIFLIGGKGALDCLDNEEVYNLMRQAKEADILYGAICISPRILCRAGLVNDKKITGWDGDNKLAEKCPNSDVVGVPVVIDGRLITARDPHAAQEFGEAILKALK